MILLQTDADEFPVGGTALSITVSGDPGENDGIVGIASVEEGSRVNGGLRHVVSMATKAIKGVPFLSLITASY